MNKQDYGKEGIKEREEKEWKKRERLIYWIPVSVGG